MEISFASGSFVLVGDLGLPAWSGPRPVVVVVHGSAPADRIGSGTYLPVLGRVLQAGYATLSWDKPGSGESTGQLDDLRVAAGPDRPGCDRGAEGAP